MNEMQIFDNEEFGSVRTLMIDDDPWFVGKDVATALGYAEPTKATREKVDVEDRGMSKIDTPSGAQNMIIINESGLYCLILSSKLPTAKKFKRWVTSEVLPALRKTGSYTVTESVPERPLTRDDYLAAARILAGCRNERLPLVVTMLDRAGLDMSSLSSAKTEKEDPDPKINEYEQEKLRAVLSQYKESYVAEKMGLSRTLIGLYRNGRRVPRQSRYLYMMDILDKDGKDE